MKVDVKPGRSAMVGGGNEGMPAWEESDSLFGTLCRTPWPCGSPRQDCFLNLQLHLFPCAAMCQAVGHSTPSRADEGSRELECSPVGGQPVVSFVVQQSKPKLTKPRAVSRILFAAVFLTASQVQFLPQWSLPCTCKHAKNPKQRLRQRR